MKKIFLSLLLATTFLFVSCGDKEIHEVQILAVNDMHANIDDFPHLAFVADSLRSLYPEMILVSAGDNRTGNPYNDYNPTQPNAPMVNLMNELHFDVCCLGNHEFDNGAMGMRYLTQKANFPIICANVDVSKVLGVKVDPFAIIEKNGVKVGFLGLLETTNNNIPMALPKNMTDFTFVDPIEKAMESTEYRAQCDVFVALTHIGKDSDTILASKMPCLDLIIGGHSHNLIEPYLYKNVMVSQAKSKLRYANFFKIKVQGGKVIEREGVTINLQKSSSDDRFEAMVAEVNSNPYFKKVVGHAEDHFTDKCALGLLMTEASREVAGADIAFQNPGGVRLDNLLAGDITLNDVYLLDPFSNDIFVYDMTKEQVRNFILKSSQMDYGLTHVAGVHYTATVDAEGCIVELKDVFFDEDKDVYRVSMNSYMSSSFMPEALTEPQFVDQNSIEAVLSYLEHHKTVNFRDKKSYEIVEN